MKKRIAAAAASIALAASLAACSGNTVEAPAPAQGQSEAPAQTPAPARDSAAKFGGAVTFPGGVQVSVAKPTTVPAGQYASGAVEGKITVVTLTVTNGSDQSIDAILMGYPRVTYGAEGEQAKLAFDDAVGSDSFGTILPGEKQSVKLGYGVPAAGLASLRVEVSNPGLGDPAVFKG